MEVESKPDPTKIVDLMSRINGGLFEIPDLDFQKNNRDRRVDKICLTISLMQRRFGDKLCLVPWALLKFIGESKFRYGVRSIAQLIDLIPNSDKITDRITMDELNLPFTSSVVLKKSSIAYHILPTEFG